MNALRMVEIIYERIANRRSNSINKASREIVDRFGVIALEDLDIKQKP